MMSTQPSLPIRSKALGPRWIWFAMVGGADSIDDYCPGAAGTSPDNLTPITVG